MTNFNYCHDECEFNKEARHFWQEASEKNDGTQVTRGKSDASNKVLQCALGYSQTANSHKALLNCLSQGSRICPKLMKLFKGVK